MPVLDRIAAAGGLLPVATIAAAMSGPPRYEARVADTPVPVHQRVQPPSTEVQADQRAAPAATISDVTAPGATVPEEPPPADTSQTDLVVSERRLSFAAMSSDLALAVMARPDADARQNSMAVETAATEPPKLPELAFPLDVAPEAPSAPESSWSAVTTPAAAETDVQMQATVVSAASAISGQPETAPTPLPILALLIAAVDHGFAKTGEKTYLPPSGLGRRSSDDPSERPNPAEPDRQPLTPRSAAKSGTPAPRWRPRQEPANRKASPKPEIKPAARAATAAKLGGPVGAKPAPPGSTSAGREDNGRSFRKARGTCGPISDACKLDSVYCSC